MTSQVALHILHLQHHPILSQLHIEEALLRNDTRNWCVINEGSPRAIVMGISGRPEILVHTEQAALTQVPIIKRFSGGGTVIVDENTLFVTFIFQKNHHAFSAYPEPIMRWSEELYKNVFQKDDFALRENDYVFGEKKCGGNAQYIKKERWLHHTSFLWDYHPENMSLLRHPPRTPTYRQDRTHTDFLCKLRDHFTTKQSLIDALKKELAKRYSLTAMQLNDVAAICDGSSRQTTQLLRSCPGD